MTDPLYDALEICLKALDAGQSVDSVLKGFPKLAAELRPILEASLQAQNLGRDTVPQDALRRGRARLLQRAAQMREARHRTRLSLPDMFARTAIALILVVALLVGGMGLVQASAQALPGDGLYSVKRGWENVQLAAVIDPKSHDSLQSLFAQQRLNEINELLVQDRSQPVTFSGLVTQHADGTWLVSGIPVHVSGATKFADANIADSMPVTVVGSTAGGVLLADEIQPVQPGALLPPLNPSKNSGHGDQKSNSPSQSGSSNGSNQAASTPSAANNSGTRGTPQTFAFRGVVDGIRGNQWIINGQTVYVDQTNVNGSVDVGAIVKFQGYYDADGNYVATNVQVESQGNSHSGGGSSGNGNGKGNGEGGSGDGGDDGGGGGN